MLLNALRAEPRYLEGHPRVREGELRHRTHACAVRLEIRRKESGDLLFTNRFSLFLRGEGGFGGEPGPKAGNDAPDRAPDGVVESPSLPQQALIYRLSGDKNPLHADPEFAKMGGFDKPIQIVSLGAKDSDIVNMAAIAAFNVT